MGWIPDSTRRRTEAVWVDVEALGTEELVVSVTVRFCPTSYEAPAAMSVGASSGR